MTTDEERLKRSQTDDNILIDLEDDTIAWRRRLRKNPTTAMIYRVAIFVIGLVVTVVGLILVPLPGPGWLIVFFGLAIWSTEFEFAHRLRVWVMAKVKAWTEWLKKQPRWVHVLVGIGTALFVAALIYVALWVYGVPSFLPDGLKDWLHSILPK